MFFRYPWAVGDGAAIAMKDKCIHDATTGQASVTVHSIPTIFYSTWDTLNCDRHLSDAKEGSIHMHI